MGPEASALSLSRLLSTGTDIDIQKALKAHKLQVLEVALPDGELFQLLHRAPAAEPPDIITAHAPDTQQRDTHLHGPYSI